MNYSVRKLDEEHYLGFFETTTSSGEGTELGDWLQTKAREYQKLMVISTEAVLDLLRIVEEGSKENYPS